MRHYWRTAFLTAAIGVLAISVPAQTASETASLDRAFIVIADVENGLALVPEGSVVPAGVKISVRAMSADSRVESIERTADGGTALEAADQGERQLVFAYAPTEKFDAARRSIAASQRDAEAKNVVESGQMTGATAALQVALTDTWIYVYYPGGSYHAARRVIWFIQGNSMPYQFGTATSVYSEAGDYYRGYLTASQASTTTPYYTVSKSCQVEGYWGGPCGTPTYARQTSNQAFQETVKSTGYVRQKQAEGGCRLGSEALCNVTYQSTIYVDLRLP